MKPWYLWLHRWLTLVFSIPLAIVIVSGLILSFEPIATVSAIKPGTVKPEAVVAAIQKHDPNGKARMIVVGQDAGTLGIRGGGIRAQVDLKSGDKVSASGASLFRTARQLHEHLLLRAKWLVVASTIAMLVLMVLGIFMGLPTLRNTVSGWHKAIAWFLLPLLILSPLTGLGIAFHVSFAGPSAATGAPPANMAEAVQIVAKDHDLSRMIWLRKFGRRAIVRLVEDSGEYRIYLVTKAGTVAEPRNWVRLLHEGNWLGTTPALINVLISLAFMTLMGTGLFIWARRKLRPRNRVRTRAPA